MFQRSTPAVLLVASLVSSASADGLIYKLPADGTAAVYDIKMKDGERERTGTFTIKSVGQKEVDGEQARWIELKFEGDEDGERVFVQRAKALVHEKHLKRGGSPFQERIELWSAQNDDDPKKVTGDDGPEVGPVPVFLAGPFADAKKLEASSVDSGLGKLKCEGVSGTVTVKEGAGNVTINMENRLHDRAPFGVAQSIMKFKVERDGEVREQGTLTMTLKEIGMNAKSEFPAEE